MAQSIPYLIHFKLDAKVPLSVRECQLQELNGLCAQKYPKQPLVLDIKMKVGLTNTFLVIL